MSTGHRKKKDESSAINRHILALVNRYLPDSSMRDAYMKGFITRHADLHFNWRFAEFCARAEAAQVDEVAEKLIAESAFWRSMYEVELSASSGKPLPQLPNSSKKLS